MKPIERIARLKTVAAEPALNPSRAAWLANEAAWLAAFVGVLTAEVEGTLEQTRREREAAAAEPEREPGDRRCMNTYVEGAAFVRDVYFDHLHTDPELFAAGPDNPYAVPDAPGPAPDVPPRPAVLEFDPVDGGPE